MYLKKLKLHSCNVIYILIDNRLNSCRENETHRVDAKTKINVSGHLQSLKLRVTGLKKSDLVSSHNKIYTILENKMLYTYSVSILNILVCSYRIFCNFLSLVKLNKSPKSMFFLNHASVFFSCVLLVFYENSMVSVCRPVCVSRRTLRF